MACTPPWEGSGKVVTPLCPEWRLLSLLTFGQGQFPVCTAYFLKAEAVRAMQSLLGSGGGVLPSPSNWIF